AVRRVAVGRARSAGGPRGQRAGRQRAGRRAPGDHRRWRRGRARRRAAGGARPRPPPRPGPRRRARGAPPPPPPPGGAAAARCRRAGAGACLAVEGGVAARAVSGSAATDLGAGLGGRPLVAGAALALGAPPPPGGAPPPDDLTALLRFYAGGDRLRFVPAAS